MSNETTESPSVTYKIKPPEDVSVHAAYFTIVGDPPEAFFFNSKEMNSFHWITGQMTSWSRLLRAGVPIGDLIKDMKETFGKSYHVAGKSIVIPKHIEREVHCIVHHLGIILEYHINNERKQR